ncbi:MAG TPA: flagellar hook-basal body complex protein FliE [Devosia sp.]|jgi:flagellar hook-basal body complex protein FliE|nr:flagellar hook-basal body complex protein FliE [Devosia sp.]
MSTPFNAVAAAYNNASRLIQDAGKASSGTSATGGQGSDFGKLLADQVQGVMNAGKQSDQMSLDLLNGKANVVDVATAVSQTELAMESMVAVRDKVISAYEEIMRMPI